MYKIAVPIMMLNTSRSWKEELLLQMSLFLEKFEELKKTIENDEVDKKENRTP